MRLRVNGPVFSIFCLPTRPNLGIDRRVVQVRCPSVEHATRAELRQVGGVFLAGIVELFRFLFRVEVIEIAEPLIEAMDGRQKLVAVSQMIFPKLRGVVADRLQDLREGRILLLDASGRSRYADGRQARADWDTAP